MPCPFALTTASSFWLEPERIYVWLYPCLYLHRLWLFPSPHHSLPFQFNQMDNSSMPESLSIRHHSYLDPPLLQRTQALPSSLYRADLGHRLWEKKFPRDNKDYEYGNDEEEWTAKRGRAAMVTPIVKQFPIGWKKGIGQCGLPELTRFWSCPRRVPLASLFIPSSYRRESPSFLLSSSFVYPTNSFSPSWIIFQRSLSSIAVRRCGERFAAKPFPTSYSIKEYPLSLTNSKPLFFPHPLSSKPAPRQQSIGCMRNVTN